MSRVFLRAGQLKALEDLRSAGWERLLGENGIEKDGFQELWHHSWTP